MPGSASCASTVSDAHDAGCGSHDGPPSGPKPNGADVARPGQRHAASVSPRVDPAGAVVHRVLDEVAGQVLDLGEAELVALIDVEAARQRGDEQRRGARPVEAEARVGGHAEALLQEREGRVFAAVPGDRPRHVVVAEHPRARGADRGVGGERRRDGRAEGSRAPRPRQEVEVEGRVHLVGPEVGREPLDVGHPDLADEHARAGVGVGDRAPRPVDVVQLVAVFGRVVGLLADLGQIGVLDEQGGRVDAHAGDAAVEPEPQDVLVLAADVGVVPVQVGLLGREHVQVPLPRRAVGVRWCGSRSRPGSSRPSASGSRRRPRPCRGGTRTAPARGCQGRRRAPPGTTRAGR